MATPDIATAAREVLRWRILVTLDAGRPYPVTEDIILKTLTDMSSRVTLHELRRELEYLHGRKLIEITGNDPDTDCWDSNLTSIGVDLVEYAVDCRAGIARPPKRG
ncbi:MAG: hypothetical protein LBM75_09285 [Myxococcales bacterium]|jgi:hypothetical protein|nr:hypothetical protein [Myxococcales bacterium]